MYPSISPLCDRCKGVDGSLTDIFWLGPHIQKYWSEFSGVYGKDIPPDPDMALFGCSETALNYTSEEQLAMMLGMVAPKKMILTAWKSSTPLPEMAQ